MDSDRKNRLLKELSEIDERAKLVYIWPTMVNNLSDFTEMEKTKIFDRLYCMARDLVEELAKSGYMDEDSPHYIYKCVMTSMLGKDVFSRVINKLYD